MSHFHYRVLFVVAVCMVAGASAGSTSWWPVSLRHDGAVRVVLSAGSPARRVYALIDPTSSEVVADAATLGVDEDANVPAGLLVDIGQAWRTWFPARLPVTTAEYATMSTERVSMILGIDAPAHIWMFTRCMHFTPRSWTLHTGSCSETVDATVACASATPADLADLCPAPDGSDVMAHLAELMFRAEIRYDAHDRVLGLRGARVVDTLAFVNTIFALAVGVALVIWYFDSWPRLRRTAGLLGMAMSVAGALYVCTGGQGVLLEPLDDPAPPAWLPAAFAGIGAAPQSLWTLPLDASLIVPVSAVVWVFGGFAFLVADVFNTELKSWGAIGMSGALWSGVWLLQADSARGDWSTLMVAMIMLVGAALTTAYAWYARSWLHVAVALYVDGLAFVYVIQPIMYIVIAPDVLGAWALAAFIMLFALWAILIAAMKK